MRVWLLTALVALALALNFSLLSPRIAQSAEETVRARLAAATNAVRAQIELRDAKINPRLAAESPDLIDSLRPPADPTLPVPRPDEKALRAAAAAAQPTEPDLLIVATADGATYSRRGKAAVMSDDIKDLPLVKATLDGNNVTTTFAMFDGSLFRVQAARIPGSVGVVVTGLLVDDHLAQQLRAAADTDVTFLREGQIVASSLPESKRSELTAWVKSSGPGYGVLPLRLMGVGSALDGKLPYHGSTWAVRAANVPFEGGVMGALTISAFPHFGWVARYQAYYAIAFIFFVLFGFVWGLLPGEKQITKVVVTSPRPVTTPVPEKVARVEAGLIDANAPAAKITPAKEVPWTQGDPGWGGLPSSVKSASEPRPEPLDGAKLARAPEPAFTSDLGTRATDVSSVPYTQSPFTSEPGASKPAGPLDLVSAKSSENSESVVLAPEPSLAQVADSSRQPFDFPPPSKPPPSGMFTEIEPSISGLERQATAAASAEPEAGDADPFAHLRSATEPGRDSSPGIVDEISPSDVIDPFAPAADVIAYDAASPAAEIVSYGDQGEDKGFSFANMISEADNAPPPGPASRPLLSQIEREPTAPGEPSEELLASVRDDDSQYPGDEPTRIEAVSAALLDKLREKDEADAAWSHGEAPAEAETTHEPGQDDVETSPEHDSQSAAALAPPADEVPSGEPAEDPDEAHFEDTYRQFIDMRHQTGEPSDRVSYDKFVAKLKRNREELLAKHQARGVRFSVYMKDGRAAIKASAIR